MFFRTEEIFGQVCLNTAFLNTTLHSGKVFKGRSRLADYFLYTKVSEFSMISPRGPTTRCSLQSYLHDYRYGKSYIAQNVRNPKKINSKQTKNNGYT